MILKKGSLKKLPALLKVTFFNTLHTLPITVACMAVATLTANAIFHLSGNAINVSIIYILAILLHARYTKCYSAGIIASLYSVFWVNYAYTYPYMTLNFTLSGYPLTFVGMTFISCFTSSICIMLSKQSVQIQEKDRMLMQAEKETMRANLLRAMSHDLRTPLTTIIGSSAAYLEQENEMSPEEKRKLIHNIEEDAQWLLNMVENILSVTRINTADAKVTKTAEPVEEVISEAVIRLKKRITDADIHVKVPDDFLMIPMDAMLIEQVIINLLENAIIHSRSEKPIDCFVTCDERYVTFHVRDYGIGIPEDKLATIFDGTGSSSNSDSSRGMGIGLSICKTIVAAHDGTITACNIPGEVPTGHHFRHPIPAPCGAEFSFTLPRGDYSHTVSEEPL